MSGRKTFVGGDILLASELNGFLMDQAVMVFDDAAARTTAIPSPSEGMVTYLRSTDAVEKYNGTAWVSASGGFTARETITATNASWPVPALGAPIVKVTVIGGGGGGGNAGDGLGGGSTGGTTTFNAGGAGSISASGGLGGSGGNVSQNGVVGAAGSVAANHGFGGLIRSSNQSGQGGRNGYGGQITVTYLNLSGISTVNVTVGQGGPGAVASIDGIAGGAGGRGEVIVEYVAA
jgi:hypothetical protein